MNGVFDNKGLGVGCNWCFFVFASCFYVLGLGHGVG